MKKALGMFIVMSFVIVYAFNVSHAGIWDKCRICHNGTMAPDEKTLKQRYKTADEFMKAARKASNPMMNNYKGDADLKEAAKYLGLK